MPLVSVVIPTFGRPALLRRAIDSVLAQSLSDLELIVVVDGDDPATTDCLNAIGDSRLTVLVNAAKCGAGRTRDAGVAASRAEWVAFLDDDDEWLPHKLEKQLTVAAHGPAVIMTLSHVVTPQGSFVRPLVPYDADSQTIDEWLFDRTTWLKGGLNFVQASSLMMPRALFADVQFGDTKHEDWEVVLRAVKQHGLPLRTVPEPLVLHYFGEARPTLSKATNWAQSLDWIDGLGEIVTPRAYSGFVLNTVGTASSEVGDYAAVGPLLKTAFRHGRPTARQLFRFALSWAIPPGLRRRVRAALQGGKAPDGARATR